MSSAEYPHVTKGMHVMKEGRRVLGRPSWPDGARCVVALTVDFDGPGNEVGRGADPVGANSAGRYSARRGVPRFLALFDEERVRTTFFVPGYDAECYPDVVREIAGRGHEVGAHGYLHEGHLLPKQEEARRLALTHDILTDVLGSAPAGWRAPSGFKTRQTLKMLHELGYRYDSSDKDADVPYLLRLAKDSFLIEIPNNTLSLDDFPFYHHSRTPVSEVLAQWIDEFESSYAEHGFFHLTVHPRSGWGSGTASRTGVMRRLIRHIKRYDGVAFVRLSELAAWVSRNADRFEEVQA